MVKKKILFLCSGGGGSMIFVDMASKHLNAPFEVAAVVADRECDALEYGKINGMRTQFFKPWRELTSSIVDCIRDINPDIVVTNISKILPKDIFKCCNARFINLHWSLLPAFGGVIGFKTLELAKEKNSRIIGATCHYVNEELDGGTIISQGALTVDWNDSIEAIQRKVYRTASKVLLNGIYEVLGFTGKNNSSDGSIYSPSLVYDDSFIDEAFWQGTFFNAHNK